MRIGFSKAALEAVFPLLALACSPALLQFAFMPPTSFTDVPAAIEEIRNGRMIVVVDDEDRENEGDLTLAAEKVTPETINFMAKYGRGLICLAMTEERLDHLRIGPMTRGEYFQLRHGVLRSHRRARRSHDGNLGL